MELLGYVASVLIGVSLSLIGGGGSILTVPVLVYLLEIEPLIATAYSLFIVGLSSLIGAVPKFKQNLVSVKTAVIFGIPSIISVFLTRYWIVPMIPSHIVELGSVVLTKNVLMMIVFAVLMVFASISMIRNKPCVDCDENAEPEYKIGMIFFEGTLVGALTGFVGAGGGFLIIPALVILSKLSFKKAVGTSLVIIAAKSLIGFLGDVFHTKINWLLLGSVTLLAVLGIFLGDLLSKKIKGDNLKVGFGWFVLIMGVGIFVKELFL
ncbi:MAG: sulfite exporter TauE/SafE family protein [Cytophagales bacterium]